MKIKMRSEKTGKRFIYSNKKLFIVLFLSLLISQLVVISLVSAATYRTPNFVIETADPRLAEYFGKTAEYFRNALAIWWAGQAMPNWSQPCAITVQTGPHLGAGGATSFMFNKGEVYGWRMTIQGSAERVSDSVLPHEITHMIFASYFREPLPRWADEGGATYVEAASERAKHKMMLLQFLRSGRGISFNQMLVMTEYPADIMPLYAQGASVAQYLIQQGGPRKFLCFLKAGMDGGTYKDNNGNDITISAGDWTTAVKYFYGFNDLGVFQNTWLAWVAKGSPDLNPQGTNAIKTSGTSIYMVRDKNLFSLDGLGYVITPHLDFAKDATITMPGFDTNKSDIYRSSDNEYVLSLCNITNVLSSNSSAIGSNGGKISLGNKITLDIPAGALSNNSNITIQEYDLKGCSNEGPVASTDCFNSSKNPIPICTCIDLQRMRENLSGNYILKNDIDCSDTDIWNFGDGFVPINVFSGMLDGARYRILNLYINRPNESYVGLFGINYGVVRNLGISYANIIGGTIGTGIVAGYSDHLIDSVFTSGTVISNNTYAYRMGGLVGTYKTLFIRDSYSSANIISNKRGYLLGGLVGGSTMVNSYLQIERSYASGNVTSTNGYFIGGLVGGATENNSVLKITDSFSIGNVSKANVYAGGFIGGIMSGVNMSIVNCYWNSKSGPLYWTYKGNLPGCTGIGDLNYFTNYTNSPMNKWFSAWDRYYHFSGYPKFMMTDGCGNGNCNASGKDCYTCPEDCGACPTLIFNSSSNSSGGSLPSFSLNSPISDQTIAKVNYLLIAIIIIATIVVILLIIKVIFRKKKSVRRKRKFRDK